MIHYFQHKYPRKNLSREELAVHNDEYVLVKRCKHNKVLKFYSKKEKCYKYFNLTNYAITGIYAWGYFLYRCFSNGKYPDEFRYIGFLKAYKCSMNHIDRFVYSMKQKRIISLEYSEYFKKKEKKNEREGIKDI